MCVCICSFPNINQLKEAKQIIHPDGSLSLQLSCCLSYLDKTPPEVTFQLNELLCNICDIFSICCCCCTESSLSVESGDVGAGVG